VMLIHVKEAIHLLINNLHNVIRDCLALEVLQELFCLLLLFVLFVCKMSLEALIYLFKLLLCLCLVGPEIVLLLKLVPNLQLVNKVCKQAIDLLQSLCQVGLLIDILDLMPGNVHQKLIGVDVLWHSEGSQQHVNEILHDARVETLFHEFQIGYELLILGHFVALEILLFQEFEDRCLLLV
jgi:hypothetical protein